MTDFPHLPGVLADIAGATSEVVALRLARALGGTEIHLTRKLVADNKLVKAVGMDDAQKIVDALGYGPLLIPMAAALRRGQKHAQIARRRSEGVKVSDVALAAGCHERSVYRVQAAADRPLPLFDQDED